MFTDSPAIPMTVEILLEYIVSQPKGAGRDEIYRLLQPEASDAPRAKEALRAAIDLGVVEESGGVCRCVRNGDASDILIEALDEKVLASVDIEYYFARVYSYLLGLGSEAASALVNDEEFVVRFNKDVFAGVQQSNPFNPTKLDGFRRWFGYAGLGWIDPARVLQCNPYKRLARRLAMIFREDRTLLGEEFMERLAVCCPELDGGRIFLEANKAYRPEQKRCTLGLAHALLGLHEDAVIRLHCEADSRGWDLVSAEPPNDGKTLRASRLDKIDYLKRSRQ